MKKTLPLTLNSEIVGSVEVDTETLEMVATVEDDIEFLVIIDRSLENLVYITKVII